MKKGILLLLLISSVITQAQSLKEALYGGKLKNRPGTVVRKGDDLTAQAADTVKMDTTSMAVADSSAKSSTALQSTDSASNKLNIQSNNPVTTNPLVKNEGIAANPTDTSAAVKDQVTATDENPANPGENAPAAKDNNALWKDYVNSIVNTIKTEVLPSKKVKKETYYVNVSYTIGTDGQVSIGDILLSPENSFLLQQIKDRLSTDAPRLNPVLNSTGAPRKVNKRYNFTLVKE